jgi:hypothetical protein
MPKGNPQCGKTAKNRGSEASKNAWYCWKDGKQFHSEKRDTALKSFYRKMAEEPKPKTEPQLKADKPTVKQVCDAFLSDTQSRVKANTHAT